MSREIRADYGQQYLLPPCVEDWVPADHPARFIREFVDALDLGALGMKRSEGIEGRPAYANDLLLKVWLHGYFTRTYSTRKLEKACLDSMSLVWLTGNNAPDHNTLWRFFANNKSAIKKVFKECVRIACGAGLVGMTLHALDGTKIQALASNRTGQHKKALEKELKELDAAIERIEADVERERGAEADAQWRLPEQLCDKRRLRETVADGLARMERENKEHHHPLDEDARMMKCDGKTDFAYNAQVVADADSGLIVAQDVFSDENDRGLLVPMLEEAAQTLGGRTADETLADGGYAGGEQIARAAEKGYDVLLPVEPRNAGPYHSINFRHDEQRDVVVCPHGETLEFEREKKARRGYAVRVYRCGNKNCEHRAQCSADRHGRCIEIAAHRPAVLAQMEKQRLESNRCKLKRRGSIVECVFGAVKERMGFRRFACNGVESVKAQWSLVCTAFNLGKMLKAWRAGKLKLA